MEKLATYQRTKEIIEKHDFFMKKNFGQNFLIDQHVINKIINIADISKDDLIIEIGPGIGTLTEELLQRAGKVITIEIDKKLIPILNDTLSSYDNLEIINEDVLKVDIREIVENSGYKSAKLVANLPYYITTPIIMELLEKRFPISQITVMIQKEVANRMSAKVGTKDYGALTLAVNYYATSYLVANVPPNCFMPRPNVDSAVIQLTTLTDTPVVVEDEGLFFKVIKAGFSMRRKTLVNCLFNTDYVTLSKTELEEMLESININPKIRGEALDLDTYALITNELIKHI